MLSEQSYSILTKNGTVVSDYMNKALYWTMTPYTSSSDARCVNDYGGAISSGVTGTGGLHPVINISLTNTIASGNGTPNSPYVIAIN